MSQPSRTVSDSSGDFWIITGCRSERVPSINIPLDESRQENVDERQQHIHAQEDTPSNQTPKLKLSTHAHTNSVQTTIDKEILYIPKKALRLYNLMLFIHKHEKINKKLYETWNTSTTTWNTILQWTDHTINTSTKSSWRGETQKKIGAICSQARDGTISLTKHWKTIIINIELNSPQSQ
jgi:hypothetical protein